MKFKQTLRQCSYLGAKYTEINFPYKVINSTLAPGKAISKLDGVDEQATRGCSHLALELEDWASPSNVNKYLDNKTAVSNQLRLYGQSLISPSSFPWPEL